MTKCHPNVRLFLDFRSNLHRCPTNVRIDFRLPWHQHDFKKWRVRNTVNSGVRRGETEGTTTTTTTSACKSLQSVELQLQHGVRHLSSSRSTSSSTRHCGAGATYGRSIHRRAAPSLAWSDSSSRYHKRREASFLLQDGLQTACRSTQRRSIKQQK